MNQDPFGLACLDYLKGNKNINIEVLSDLVEDDVIPVNHLFRDYSRMPKLEQKALQMCKGKVLDVGAGAGSHALWLQEQGIDVTALDTSSMACEVMKEREVKDVVLEDFFDFKRDRYDTILMMMNGIGIVGTIDRLSEFFMKVKQLLKPNGQLVVDSSDLCYLFEDEETEEIPELMENYYGEVDYQMKYKNAVSEKFNWLFIDPKMFQMFAEENGFKFEMIYEGEHYEYLAKLVFKKD